MLKQEEFGRILVLGSKNYEKSFIIDENILNIQQINKIRC